MTAPCWSTASSLNRRGAADDDARRQIAECRRYIADFEAALERSSAPAELIDRMTAAYPDLANPYTLWVAAYDLLGTRT